MISIIRQAWQGRITPHAVVQYRICAYHSTHRALAQSGLPDLLTLTIALQRQLDLRLKKNLLLELFGLEVLLVPHLHLHSRDWRLKERLLKSNRFEFYYVVTFKSYHCIVYVQLLHVTTTLLLKAPPQNPNPPHPTGAKTE
mmetsp:Transcript_8801/g.12899  ORF Transcript_8801/g.12899 Transcript_8801/m.12899 type:complete len:141 (+) Transcript_8801:2-424(+)